MKTLHETIVFPVFMRVSCVSCVLAVLHGAVLHGAVLYGAVCWQCYMAVFPVFMRVSCVSCVLAVLHGALSCCNRRDMCAGGVTWDIFLLLQT